MKVLFFLLFFIFSSCDDDKGKNIIPGLVLSNWHDSMISYAVNRNFYAQTIYRRGPGVTGYYTAPTYDLSAIQNDSFAIIYGDQKITEPQGIEVIPSFSNDGVITSTFYQYKKQPFTGLQVSADIEFTPLYPYYTITYHFSATEDDAELTFLSYITLSNTGDNHTGTHFVQSDTHPRYITTMRGNNQAAEEKETFGMGIVRMGDGVSFSSYSVSSSSPSESSPLSQFASKGELDNKTDCVDVEEAEMGFAFKIQLKKGQTTSLTLYRSYRSNKKILLKACNLAETKDFDEKEKERKAEYERWLAKGKRPTTLTQKQMELYNHSLLLMKNALNPTIGSILSSMHPRYEYKAWMRDSFFSAFIFIQAGYEEEGRRIWEWMSNVKMHEATPQIPLPYFYSTYSGLTGLPIDFVDPQLDSMGMYLSLTYLLSTLPSSLPYLRQSEKRIRDVMEFMRIARGYSYPSTSYFHPPPSSSSLPSSVASLATSLFPADYSIWEESSDSMTGEQKARGYYAWTQAWAYAGMMAGSRLCRYYFHDYTMAETLKRSGMNLLLLLQDKMVVKTNNTLKSSSTPSMKFVDKDGKYSSSSSSSSSLTPTHILRQLVQKFDEDSNELEPIPEEVADSSTFSWYWLGLMGLSSSSNPYIQTPFIDSELARNHYNWVIENNQKGGGKEKVGVSRYPNDHYFYDGIFSPAMTDDTNPDPTKREQIKEASSASPPWGVTTMFTLWAELSMGIRSNLPSRLNYLTLTSFSSSLPSGEAIDASLSPLWSSAPDIYEHGGVFVYSCLLNERKAKLINPLAWEGDSGV